MDVRAKRLGWDEQLLPEHEFDYDSYEHPDDDLEGELVAFSVPETAEHAAMEITLVGGQEADPKTIVPVTNAGASDEPRDAKGRWAGSAAHLEQHVKESYAKLYGGSLKSGTREWSKAFEQYKKDRKHLEELKQSAFTPRPATPPPTQPLATRPRPAETPHDATDRLHSSLSKLAAKVNLVHLGDLRAAHPDWSKEQFDQVLHQARKEGKITLSAAEGRHGISEYDRNSGVYDPGSGAGNLPVLMLYASLKR